MHDHATNSIPPVNDSIIPEIISDRARPIGPGKELFINNFYLQFCQKKIALYPSNSLTL